jgi:hypothetical protein
MDNILKKIKELKVHSEDLKADVVLLSDIERILTEDHMKNYSNTFGEIQNQLNNISKELNNLVEDDD